MALLTYRTGGAYANRRKACLPQVPSTLALDIGQPLLKMSSDEEDVLLLAAATCVLLCDREPRRFWELLIQSPRCVYALNKPPPPAMTLEFRSRVLIPGDAEAAFSSLNVE
ncbi:hypothetical protein J6590_102433 [Homalodisca vitripennis]|nr:hypothetical protein J6590_102433 [Homalodisca vitripennis]